MGILVFREDVHFSIPFYGKVAHIFLNGLCFQDQSCDRAVFVDDKGSVPVSF